MRRRKRDLVWFGGTLALAAGLLYLCTPGADVRILHTFSRACQRTARILGQWGLEAERQYLSMLDKNRMV